MTTQHTFPAERTAVLTGAASARGIGRATADRLASEGWSIAILDLNAEDAKAAAEEIGANRAVKAIGVGADVSDEASVDRAITEIEQSLPPIVGLVNLAGISSPTPFMETTVAEWDKVFAINMRGTFVVSQRNWAGLSASPPFPPSAAAAPTPRWRTAHPRPASSDSPVPWPAKWASTTSP